MRKLIVMLTLAAFATSVPMAFALDANRDSLRQGWRDQVNLEKQQARIEGLKPDTVVNINVPDITKLGTSPGLKAPGRR